MALALNNPRKVDMPLSKKKKQPGQAIIIIQLLVLLHLNKTALEVNQFC